MGQINHSRPQFRIIDSGKRAVAAEIQKVIRPLKPGKIAIEPEALPKISAAMLSLRREAATARASKLKNPSAARKRSETKKARLTAARRRQKVLDKAIKQTKKSALATEHHVAPSADTKLPRVKKPKLGRGLLNPMQGVVVETKRKPRVLQMV